MKKPIIQQWINFHRWEIRKSLRLKNCIRHIFLILSRVDASWKNFFAGFEFARKNFGDSKTFERDEKIDKEFAILNLIHGYRQREAFVYQKPTLCGLAGSIPQHWMSKISDYRNRIWTLFLRLETALALDRRTLRAIIEHLEATYCQSIGVEYVFMRDPELIEWLKFQDGIEPGIRRFSLRKNENIFIIT